MKNVTKTALALSGAGLLILSLASNAFAELPKSDSKYRLAVSYRNARQKTDAAIEDGIEDMNFITRHFARKALKKHALPIIEWIKVQALNNSVMIQFAGDKPLTYKNGSTKNLIGSTGEKMRSTMRFDDHTITITNTSDRGSKIVKIVFSKDCTHANITFLIPKTSMLPENVMVVFPYSRVGAAKSCSE